MEDHGNAFRMPEAYSPQYILSGIHIAIFAVAVRRSSAPPVIRECIPKTGNRKGVFDPQLLPTHHASPPGIPATLIGTMPIIMMTVENFVFEGGI